MTGRRATWLLWVVCGALVALAIASFVNAAYFWEPCDPRYSCLSDPRATAATYIVGGVLALVIAVALPFAVRYARRRIARRRPPPAS